MATRTALATITTAAWVARRVPVTVTNTGTVKRAHRDDLADAAGEFLFCGCGRYADQPLADGTTRRVDQTDLDRAYRDARGITVTLDGGDSLASDDYVLDFTVPVCRTCNQHDAKPEGFTSNYLKWLAARVLDGEADPAGWDDDDPAGWMPRP